MDPIELAFSIIGTIFILVYCTLYVLLLNNRSEKGKKEFWSFTNQLFDIWLVSSELYTEKGNRYRNILLAVLIVGTTLLISLVIFAPTNTK